MKKSILVVDDEELELELLRQIFESDYNVILASNGKEAITQLNKHYQDIVLILLDLVMPIINGYQVMQVLKASDAFKDIPIAMVTSNADQLSEISCYTMGAMAVIHKPFVAQIVHRQVNNIIDMYQSNLRLERSLNMQLTKLNNFYDHLTDGICNLVEFRDLESQTHTKRVKGLTKIMAETYQQLFPETGLFQEDIENIVHASAIHDIGKIAIPDNILLKPGTLTDEERQVMMTHTIKGCELLNLFVDIQENELFRISYEICRYHHERYDGNGYPDKLSGNEIPLSAQLVSIVDVYDALISPRVYKEPFDKTTAYQMIMDGECGIFAPKILKSFQSAKNKIEKFADSCH